MQSTAELVSAWKEAHASEFIANCPMSSTMTRESCRKRRGATNFRLYCTHRGYGSINPIWCSTCTAWSDHE